MRATWIGLGAAVIAGLGFAGWRMSRPAAVSYQEVKVTRGNLEVTILATGVVQPENRLEIKPPIAGRIETVLVREGQPVRKGQLLAWMSSTERAAMLDAARARGAEEVKRWEELYRPTAVLAPIHGTIILRNIEPGQTFTGADSVFVMSDRLTVKAQVDETDIAQIRLKQRAKVVLDAYPRQTIAAGVDQIAFDAKTVNNVTTYIVDVLPEETPPHMRSGMTANVTFFVASKESVLVVPSEAVKARDGRATVLAAASGGKPEERTVETGLTDGKQTEIVSGLAENDILLVAQLKRIGKSPPGTPFSPLGTRRVPR